MHASPLPPPPASRFPSLPVLPTTSYAPMDGSGGQGGGSPPPAPPHSEAEAAGRAVGRAFDGVPLLSLLSVGLLTAVDEAVAAAVGPPMGAGGSAPAAACTAGGGPPAGGGDGPADHVCWLGFRSFVASARQASWWAGGGGV